MIQNKELQIEERKNTDKPIIIRQKHLNRHLKKGNPNGPAYEKMLHPNSNQENANLVTMSYFIRW